MGTKAGCQGIQEVEVERTGFIKKDEANETMREEPGRKGRIPVRLITLGSEFPPSLFYDVRSTVLKETAIPSCPTFHLCLTFMSSTQFYHGKGSISPHQMQSCYYLNRAGLPNHLPTGQCTANQHLDS